MVPSALTILCLLVVISPTFNLFTDKELISASPIAPSAIIPEPAVIAPVAIFSAVRFLLSAFSILAVLDSNTFIFPTAAFKSVILALPIIACCKSALTEFNSIILAF